LDRCSLDKLALLVVPEGLNVGEWRIGRSLWGSSSFEVVVVLVRMMTGVPQNWQNCASVTPAGLLQDEQMIWCFVLDFLSRDCFFSFFSLIFF